MILEKIDENRRYDIVILGSGPSGIVLASELIKNAKNLKVLVVEAGGESFSKESQDHYKGSTSIFLDNEKLNDDDTYLSSSRLRQFGGTSNHWSNWIRPLETDDFSNWPLKREDLTPYYRRALKYVGCHHDIDFFDLAPGLLRGFQEAKYWVNPSPVRFGEKYRDIFQTENIDIIFHTSPVKVNKNNYGRVSSILLSVKGNFLSNVSCRQLVLACGAIENSRLLYSNYNDFEVRKDRIGSSFFEHMHFNIGTAWVRVDKNWGEFDATSNNEIVKVLVSDRSTDSGCRYQIDIDPVSDHTKQMNNDTEMLLKKSYEEIFNCKLEKKRIRLIMEHSVLSASALNFSSKKETSLNISLSSKEVIALRSTLNRLSTGLIEQKLGFCQSVYELNKATYNKTFAYYGYHHIGTTPMGFEIGDGIVNKDLKLFSCENVYILGSSVFKSAGYAPPTLTIVSLAIRLAEYLVKI